MGKKICIMGDICPDNDYREIFDKGEFAISNEILNLIDESEVTIANLECPAVDKGTPITKCGPSLKASLNDLELLKKYGIDIFTLANNHILDYGEKGVSETLNKCKEVGIKTFGAGSNLNEAEKPLIIDVNNKKIGLIGFAEEEFNLAGENSLGANHFDAYKSFDSIRELKKSVDYIIVFYHGGIEHYKYPSPLLQKKCRKMVECGADLVLCQHSHCIGTYEKFENGQILYGQGNAIYGYRDGNKSWNEGLIVLVDEEDFKVEFKLIKATKNGIILADELESDNRLNSIYKDSESITDKEWVKSEWNSFVYSKRAMYSSLLFGKNRIYTKANKILKNKLIDIFYSKKNKMVVMNLIRCDSHNEFIRTMLEEDVYGR